MTLRINNRRDFWSGMMFTGFGAIFAILAHEYDMGTLRQMGPGWFPFALGVLLVLLGLLITAGSARSQLNTVEHEMEPIGWRELALVLLSIGLFAFLLPYLGVVLSVMLMVATAAFAGHERRPLEVLAAAVALSFACYAIFVYGLAVPLPVWPAIIGG